MSGRYDDDPALKGALELANYLPIQSRESVAAVATILRLLAIIDQLKVEIAELERACDAAMF